MNRIFLFLAIFLIHLAAACAPIAAQETDKQKKILNIYDFDAKVSAGQPTTYLELVRKVFPKAVRLEGFSGGSGSGQGEESSRPYGATGAIPLRSLAGKQALLRHDSELHFDFARAVMLDEDRRHVALIIRTETFEKNKSGFYALAIFSLAPKPKLLAAFDAGSGRKLDFTEDFLFEDKTKNWTQFWVAGETRKTPSIREKEYVLLELRNETVRVIADDLPARRTETGCGFNQTSEFIFAPLLMCGQETFSADRLINVLRLNDEWLAVGGCGESKPEDNRKREREYRFYWNKQLGRYQKRFERDEFYLTDVSEKNVKIEPGFKGFAKPQALSGKPVLADQIYDVTLYGGGTFWDWDGDFEQQQPRSQSAFDFNFYFIGEFERSPQKYGTRRYRLDIRFVITAIRREREADGRWTNVYTCYIIAAAER
ncbi:MAG TPA: hypothetical protein VGC76_16655 [Pyrinomonadaceae bacterium]|jgi:hypothetical protein